MKLLLLFILFVFVECTSKNISLFERDTESSSQCSDQNNIFLVPGVLSSGNTNRGCLSRFGAAARGAARLQVLMPDAGSFSSVVDLQAGDGGCVAFLVPSSVKHKLELHVYVRYAESNCTWINKMTVRVLGTRVFIIQTERPRYRPGETVRLRILQLRQDLTPSSLPIEEVWLEAAPGVWGDGTRMVEWTKVRTRLGIAQLHYNIDKQAAIGEWTVHVVASDGTRDHANFWVGDYDLPTFQLTVRHSTKILLKSERLVWIVCVRYPWGEAVEGLLVIRLRGAGGAANESGVRTVVRTRAPRACHRHAVAARRVGLNALSPPHVIVAHFSFQEDGTRIWQNTSVVSEVVKEAVTLDFMANHKTVLSPGLPYKLKVKAIRYDDKPNININITICRQPTNSPSDPQTVTYKNKRLVNGSQTCENSTTDGRGVAKMSFTVSFYESYKFYNFEAMIPNETSSKIHLQLPITGKGPRATLGAVTTDAKSKTLIPLYLAMRTDTSITVHFLIITRGSMIYRWGATTQCPTSNTTADPHYAHKRTYCNNNYYNTGQNYVSDIKNTNLLRIMIPIKITHQMCPDSHLVAYFYQNDELVSATKHLEVEDCFANKAEITWMTRQVAPKSVASLIVTTSVPSLCAISSLDVAVKSHVNVKQMLVEKLRKNIADFRNITTYDAICNLENSDQSPSIVRHLSSAGIRTTRGADVTMGCSGKVLQPEPLTTPARIEFDESWLWRLVLVSSNLTAIVTSLTPDSITRYSTTGLCVANNGLALLQPTVIQVFREFFLHVNVPRTLTRGDTSVLIYRVFNYLYESLPVKIEVTSDPQIRASSKTITTCIKQRSSESQHVELVAISRGTARLNIRATVTSDVGVCQNYTANNNNNSDEIILPIKIVSEGIPIEEYRSGLLCGDGEPDSLSEVQWRWSNDSGIIKDTELWKVWAIGDVVGPLLSNADSLTSLPRGCGEQNMARVATNFLALKQVDAHSTAAAIAKNNIASGLSRQLQFVHPSGGFSAFGGASIPASTWLTAFSIRYLRHAHAMIADSPLPAAILKAETWLVKQQMENGCFRSEGQVFHRELKGALGDDSEVAAIALTAYVISSLIQGGVTLTSRTLHNSLDCLRALPTTSQSRVYAQALVTHCVLSIHDYERNIYKMNEAGYLREKDAILDKDEEVKQLVGLLKMAKRNSNFVWWDTGSLSTSIEATGYALMSLSLCPSSMIDICQSEAFSAMRWLSTHRNMQGGFLSTQDTLIGLEGLLSWSSEQTPAKKLNVSMYSTHPFSEQHAVISASSVPRAFNVKPGEYLKVKVQGKGCALVQATRLYNTLSNEARSSEGALTVQIQTHTDGVFNCINNNTNCYCAAVIEVCVLWTREFPEMALLDVRLPGGFSADVTLLYSLLTPTNPLIRRIETSTFHNRITLYLGSNLEVTRTGHYCFPIHSVGPKSRTRPAYVTVMDYYAPYVNYTQIYTIPEDCPARISHKVQQDIGPDNVFISARSLDDGDIIITEDFAFQDLPEGIPLEDPLYDYISNLEIGAGDLNESNAVLGEENKSDIAYNDEKLTLDNDFVQITTENLSSVDINKDNSKELILDTADIGKKSVITESGIIDAASEEPEKTTHVKETRSINLDTQSNDSITTTEENIKHVEAEMESQFSGFHVINSETDLEVPTGVEGPVPSFALPPDNIVKNVVPTISSYRDNYRGYNQYWHPSYRVNQNINDNKRQYNYNSWLAQEG